MRRLMIAYSRYKNSRRLRSQLKKCGENLKIFGKPKAIYGENISIGNHVNLNDGVVLNATASRISIGNNVTISQNALILAASYDVNEFLYTGKRNHIMGEIFIGDNVWICAGVIILPGVKITGENIIIAAGSVVTHNITESFVVVAGNPAKVIRKIEVSA